SNYSHSTDFATNSHPCLFHESTTTYAYTLSLHDALPIYLVHNEHVTRELQEAGVALVDETDRMKGLERVGDGTVIFTAHGISPRSEEHTSELQSRENLVCRLLLEKKKR